MTPQTPKTVETEELKAQFNNGKNHAERVFKSLAKKIPIDRKCTPHETCDWVFNNALADFDEIDPDKVPSRGTLRLLQLIKAGDTNYANFVKTIWAKTIPTKNTVEHETRFGDDGRKDLGMLNKIISDFERGGSESP